MATALRAATATDERGDAALVAATRAGDDRAFERLYSRYQRRIAGYAHSMVGDWARAEDISQEVFISALRRMRETERPIAFRPWVFEIARNACIDAYRRSSRAEVVSFDADETGALEPERPPTGPLAPEAAAEAGQELDHLLGALGSLAPSHHQILVLRELEGRSYREIGEQMGLSRPSVESTLFRARRRLLEEYDELSTGRRCARVQALLEEGVPGIREQRRVGRHLIVCRMCRRRARLAGVEPGTFERAARKVAAFLPLPAIFRRGFFSGGRGGGSMAQLAGPTLEATGPVWVKGAAVAAALALATTGAGLATRAGSPSLAPHQLRPTPAAPSHTRPADDRSRHPQLPVAPAAKPAAPASAKARSRAGRHTTAAHGSRSGRAGRQSASRTAAPAPARAPRAGSAGSPAAPSRPAHAAAATGKPAGAAPSVPTPSGVAKATGSALAAPGGLNLPVVPTLSGSLGHLAGAAGGATQALAGTVTTTTGQVGAVAETLTAPTQQVAHDVITGASGALLGR